MMGGVPTTLRTVAARCGSIAWCSTALFELQGRAAADFADDRVVLHLAEHSRHHGWHAGLVADLLPDSPALAATDLIAAPAGWPEAIDRLVAGNEVERLAGLYRVLVPRLAGEIGALAASCVGPGDAAVARVLAVVADDVGRDLVIGGALLAAALVDGDSVGHANGMVSTLDLLFANR